MKLSFLKRDFPKRAAAIAVALAAVAGVVAGREKPALEIVESKPPRIEQAALDIDLEKLNRAGAFAPQNDPFAPRSFAPPPAAAAQAGPAAAPAAPPLPFRYFGKLTENGRTDVFVMRGEEVISVVPGQKIDGEYRVDAVSESSIGFIYLPLKTRQSIDLAQADG